MTGQESAGNTHKAGSGAARLGRAVRRMLELVIVVALAIMVVLVFGNVVLRYGFNSGLMLSEELSRLLFVWLIFLGAILASLEHAHLGVDMMVRRLPASGKRACIALSGVLMLVTCVLLIVGCWRQMAVNFDNLMPVLGIPYAVLYAAGLVGGLGLAISVAYNMLVALTRPQSDDELILVRSSEEEALIADAVDQPPEHGR